MKEERYEVKPYKVFLFCDCGGLMIQKDGLTLDTYPQRYGYICNNCKTSITSVKQYPYIEYDILEKVDDEE